VKHYLESDIVPHVDY